MVAKKSYDIPMSEKYMFKIRELTVCIGIGIKQLRDSQKRMKMGLQCDMVKDT